MPVVPLAPADLQQCQSPAVTGASRALPLWLAKALDARVLGDLHSSSQVV